MTGNDAGSGGVALNPEEPLQSTLAKIRNDGFLGDAAYRLAAAAAVFPPDRIPVRALRRFGRHCHPQAPAGRGDSSAYAFNRLRRCHLPSGNDREESCRMPRIAAGELRKGQVVFWQIAPALAEVLNDDRSFTGDDRISLSVSTPAMYSFANPLWFSPRAWVQLLASSQLAEYCPWKQFGGGDRSSLLQKQPQSAVHRPLEKPDGNK